LSPQFLAVGKSLLLLPIVKSISTIATIGPSGARAATSIPGTQFQTLLTEGPRSDHRPFLLALSLLLGGFGGSAN
jgi:hypothetical protein